MDAAAITSDPPTIVEPPKSEPLGGPSNIGAILSIRVTVQVVLGSTSLPVSGLMKLARGAIVSLDQRVGDPVDVVVNGTVIARSVRGPEGTYRRTYPSGSLFAQTVGYAYTDLTQTGLERYRNTALNGETSATNLQAILDQLQGKRRQGDEILTTLDPSAQQRAG